MIKVFKLKANRNYWYWYTRSSRTSEGRIAYGRKYRSRYPTGIYPVPVPLNSKIQAQKRDTGKNDDPRFQNWNLQNPVSE
jgi:hypothetical protein